MENFIPFLFVDGNVVHLFVNRIFKLELLNDLEKQTETKGNSQHKRITNILFICASNTTYIHTRVPLQEKKRCLHFGSARNVPI